MNIETNFRRPRRDSVRNRRGVATLWLLASGCVLALLLIFLTDAANLYLARIELQNALDAAALSGVKTRCEAGHSLHCDEAARRDARAAYFANFPDTSAVSAVALDLNGGGAGANGNANCPPLQECPNGIVLLGSVYWPADSAPATLEFDADVSPDRGRVILEAGPTSDTFASSSLFTLRVEGVLPSAVRSITIDLASIGGTFDPGSGVSEAEGYGPFPPAPLSPIASYSLTETSAESHQLTVELDGGLAGGGPVSFGIDTDRAASPKVNSAQLAGAAVQITLVDGSRHTTMLASQGGLRVAGELLLGAHECAVQVYGCAEVESIAPSFSGLSFGPYKIRGRSTAWIRCATPQGRPVVAPELLRVDGVICNGFVLP